ncbi:hypothetical protein [Mycolicibacterium aubagnense]|uniref:hypothetical protein n=1 Tax=Mycolicibacterium aubagnense TaxID=319707 RepID=UPI0013D68724|nr:hypothetical protein [Mycolicibacterium aubagnense]
MAGYSIARLNRIQRRSTAATNRLAGDLLSGGILNSPANTEIEMPRQLPSSEMAMPTLVELWSRSLHDDSLIAVRPVIKRSIITLMRSGYNGDGRAYGDLVALVSYLHRELALEAQQAEDWTVERQRIVLFQRGQSLQTAPDAHSLFNLDFDRRLVAISRILAGTLQPSDLGPQFRHLSRVSAQARDVWVGLHVRLALPASISRFNADNPAGDLVLLPRKFYLQLNATGPAGNAHISYTSDDIHALMAGRIRWALPPKTQRLPRFRSYRSTKTCGRPQRHW